MVSDLKASSLRSLRRRAATRACPLCDCSPSGTQVWETRWHASIFPGRDDLLQDLLQPLHSIRFREHPTEPIHAEVGHQWVIGIAGGHNGAHLWVHGTQLRQSLSATHPAWNG